MSKNTTVTITDIKKTIEHVIGREIIYQNYSGDKEKIRLGERIEAALKKIDDTVNTAAEAKVINLSAYSPFVIDRQTPSWQVKMFEPFLMDDDTFSYDNFKSSFWLFLKTRQMGFSYVSSVLSLALGFSVPQSDIVLATKSKDWIKRIFDPYIEKFFPIIKTPLADRAKARKNMAITNQSVFSYDSPTQIYTMLPDSNIQQMGIDTMTDKNRGKGNVNLQIIDEAAFIEKFDIINKVLKPMLNFSQGSRIYGSTPNGSGWFHNVCENIKVKSIESSGKYKFFFFDLYSCGVYTEEDCDSIILDAYNDYYIGDPTLSLEEICMLIAQEYFCFVTDYNKKSKWFPRYADNPDEYTFSSLVDRKIYLDPSKNDIYVSIDYGGQVDPMAAVFFSLNGYGQFIFFDEIYEIGIGIKEMIERIQEKEAAYGIKPRAYFIDKSAASRMIGLNKNEQVRIMDFFAKFSANTLRVSPVMAMKKQLRIDMVNEHMMLDDSIPNPFTGKMGGYRFYISDLLINTRSEMKELELSRQLRNETKQREGYEVSRQIRKMKNDHGTDCVLYAISQLSGRRHIKNSENSLSRQVMQKQLQYPNKIISGMRYSPYGRKL